MLLGLVKDIEFLMRMTKRSRESLIVITKKKKSLIVVKYKYLSFFVF